MSENKKGLGLKLYSVLSVLLVAVFLVVTVTFTFFSKYYAFHPEKLATNFVSLVVGGDGYNAYKNTLVSKNMKYGDFIRVNFIDPAVKRDMEANGKDYSDDSFKGEKTLNDDGELTGKLTALMYPVYVELLETYGWDDYSAIFSGYIERLITEREALFGDKFFNDEVFFTAFEANVSQYCEMLEGTKEEYDENTGVKISEATKGKFEELFGDGCKLNVYVSNVSDIPVEEYKSKADEHQLALYGVNTEDISEVCVCNGKVSLVGGEAIAEADIIMVKIGYSWYVDNTSTDTSPLYIANP